MNSLKINETYSKARYLYVIFCKMHSRDYKVRNNTYRNTNIKNKHYRVSNKQNNLKNKRHTYNYQKRQKIR